MDKYNVTYDITENLDLNDVTNVVVSNEAWVVFTDHLPLNREDLMISNFMSCGPLSVRGYVVSMEGGPGG